MEFRVQGAGCRVQGSGFRIWTVPGELSELLVRKGTCGVEVRISKNGTYKTVKARFWPSLGFGSANMAHIRQSRPGSGLTWGLDQLGKRKIS